MMRILAGLFDDARAGLRMLRRDRGTALVAVATLAIGIGSVTAIFSAIYGSLLKPLPFRAPEELVLVGDRERRMPAEQVAGNIALSNLRDLATATTTLSGVAAYRDAEFTLSGRGAATRIRGQEVTAGFFGVLGGSLIAGRDIQVDDERPGAMPVAIVSERLWRERLNAEPPGSTIDIDGVSHQLIGVAGPITQLGNPQIWRALRPDDRALRRTARQVYGAGRLAPGVSLAAAQAELDGKFRELQRQYPEIAETRAVAVMPLENWIVGERGRSLLVLLAGAVALVLVIACVNVTNLLVVRAERRQSDLAMRAALGASRARLVRELAMEAVALALAGAAMGLLFAIWAVRLLVDFYGAALPRAWEIGVDWRVLAATCFVALMVGLAVVIIPAWRLPRASVRPSLSQDSRGHSRPSGAQRALVATETGLAVVLLALAGLLVNTVAQLSSQDLGVRTDRAVLFDVGFAGRHASPEASLAFAHGMLDRLRAIPGVDYVAAATRRPLSGGGNSSFSIAGRAETPGVLEIRDITPDYFNALGVRMLAGRHFGSTDSAVAMVNEAFVKTHFPGGTAIGERVTIGNTPAAYEIVGVAADIREFGPTADARPTAYFPYGSGPYGASTYLTIIASRASGDPIDLIPAAREAMRQLDPHVALADPITLAEQARTRIGRDRLAVRALLSLAGAMALVLTGVGLYGVTAYGVARRTREIGIRRALGATPKSVIGLMFAQAFSLALPGLVVGVVAAIFGGRLVAAYLYGVRPADPLTIAAAAAVLGLVVGLACWIPARRAARIDAAEALRV